MKAEEMRKQSDEQLDLALKDTEKHLFQLRFQSATDRLETPSEIAKARREIARIKTIQRERELEQIGKHTDDKLKELHAAAEKGESAPGVPFVGKRKPRRAAKRYAGMLEARSAAAAKAARKAASAPKGK
jgi:large subunit ribosomal protein L29